MTAKHLPIAVTLFTLLLGSASARAQEQSTAQQAKAQFKAGQAYFKEGNYVDALRAFKKANELHPLPDIVFMVGQAQRNLKMHSAAVASFRQYLEDKPEASDKEQVERLIEELEFMHEAEGSAPDPTASDPAAEPEPEPEPEPTPLADPKPQPVPQALTPARRDKPVYKKWWFWAAVGGGLVVVGGTVGIVAWQASGPDQPSGSLGSLDLP